MGSGFCWTGHLSHQSRTGVSLDTSADGVYSMSPALRIRRVTSVMVAIPLLLAACVASPTQTASPVQTPRASPVSTPTTPAPTPSASASADVPGKGWEQVYWLTENQNGFMGVDGIIVGGPGFIAWGRDGAGSEVLTTRDGSDWGAVSTPFAGQTFHSMVAASNGIIAFSVDRAGGLHEWHSPDGGTWTRATPVGLDGDPNGLVRFAGGFVAAGPLRTGCDVGAWVSSDGLSWRRSDPMPGARDTCTSGDVRVSPTIDLLRVGPGGLLAFGSVPGLGPAFWTSPDGVAWSLHRGPQVGGNIDRLVAGGPGYVAVGDAGTPNAAVWTSLDGATWTPVPDQDVFHGAAMADVAVLNDGTLVAVGTDEGAIGSASQFVAWTSTDGRIWQRSPKSVCQGEGTCDGGRVAALATDGRRLVAVGTGINDWVSPQLTPGLRPASLTLTFTSSSAGPAGPVEGYCKPGTTDDGPPGVGVIAAGLPGSFRGGLTSVHLVITADGHVTMFGYFRGDGGGFQGQASAAAVDEFLISDTTISVTAGSSPAHGRIDFRDLPARRPDSPPATTPDPSFSGSLEWTCN
jgi:hypothetical protein